MTDTRIQTPWKKAILLSVCKILALASFISPPMPLKAYAAGAKEEEFSQHAPARGSVIIRGSVTQRGGQNAIGSNIYQTTGEASDDIWRKVSRGTGAVYIDADGTVYIDGEIAQQGHGQNTNIEGSEIYIGGKVVQQGQRNAIGSNNVQEGTLEEGWLQKALSAIANIFNF